MSEPSGPDLGLEVVAIKARADQRFARANDKLAELLKSARYLTDHLDDGTDAFQALKGQVFMVELLLEDDLSPSQRHAVTQEILTAALLRMVRDGG